MGHGGEWKAMFKSVEENDISMLELYIQQGIDINYQHPEYFTNALIESIRRQHHDITKLLLANGASPHIKEDYSNKTAFQIAKEINNTYAIKLLEEYNT
jgi:ankyrin repeat protein